MPMLASLKSLKWTQLPRPLPHTPGISLSPNSCQSKRNVSTTPAQRMNSGEWGVSEWGGWGERWKDVGRGEVKGRGEEGGEGTMHTVNCWLLCIGLVASVRHGSNVV